MRPEKHVGVVQGTGGWGAGRAVLALRPAEASTREEVGGGRGLGQSWRLEKSEERRDVGSGGGGGS